MAKPNLPGRSTGAPWVKTGRQRRSTEPILSPSAALQVHTRLQLARAVWS